MCPNIMCINYNILEKKNQSCLLEIVHKFIHISCIYLKVMLKNYPAKCYVSELYVQIIYISCSRMLCLL